MTVAMPGVSALLLLPMISGRRNLHGWILLGRTGKESPYSTDDERLALAAAGQVRAAHENLTSYRALRQQSAALLREHDDLEGKIDERTSELRLTNDALRREIVRREDSEEELRASREDLAALFEASPVSIIAFDQNGKEQLAEGHLLLIDNQIDQTTGTGKLKAMFGNSDNALFPNQFVNARLLLETKKGVTVVPAAAVQRGPQGSSFAYVVKPDKTVEVRNVKVALTQGNLAVVASGIEPGEQVVTDGQDKLQGGSRVEPHAPNSSPTGSNAPSSGTAGQ